MLTVIKKKKVQSHPIDSKRILQNEFVFFFKPPDKFAEIIKTTRVLKFKEFTPKIIHMT